MDIIDRVPFGVLLRRLRLAAGLSQAALASRAGLSERAVNDLERDAKRLPRLETVTLLAKALGLAREERAALLAAARPGEAAPAQPHASHRSDDASAADRADDGQPSSDSSFATRQAHALPPLPHASRLPPAPSPFIGRAREIEAICAMLRRSEVRLLTLTGPGGIGKTRLALQVASLLEAAYADGVRFVPLASLVDPALVLPSIAERLAVPESAHQSVEQRIGEALRARELLLVLDNFEQVAAAAEEIERLLSACPQLNILTTSRAALRLSREHEYQVPPLAVPDVTDISPLTVLLACDSVALLTQCARAVVPDFAVTKENARQVVAICARLEGVPLAIQLAAARLKLLPPIMLLDRLDQQLAVLTGGPRDLPERQRTVRATLDWSYHLLTSPQQTLFRRLAVFAGGWTLESAEGICAGGSVERADILELLGHLVDHSLVLVENHNGMARYRLLEVIRQYATEKLRESGEEASLRDRHIAWFLQLAESLDSQTWIMPRPEAHVALKPEADNLRAALAWSRGDVSGQMELRLAGALMNLWTAGEMVNEGKQIVYEALGRADSTARTSARARALMVAASIAGIQTDPVGAELVSEEALAILQSVGEERDQARALILSARARYWLGDPVDLSTARDESIRLCRKLGDLRAYAETLWIWGDLALEQGDYAQARLQFMEAIARCRNLADTTLLSYPLISLARIECAEGHIERARALAEEGLALRENAPAWLHAIAITSLGEVERCAGNDKRATELFTEALAIFRAQFNEPGAAWTAHNLGHMALRAGDSYRAAELFAEALAVRRQNEYAHGVAAELAGLAGVARLDEQYTRAARLLGAVDAVVASSRSVLAPPDQAAFDRDVAALRQLLGPAEFDAAWTAGHRLSMALAISEALSSTSGSHLTPE